MILACSHINKAFLGNVVLDDITFHIEEKDKLALIGINGSGKTTLLRIIANKLEADSGEIIKNKDCSIGYLPQHVSIESDKTVYDELLTVFDHLIEMEDELTLMEAKISSANPKELAKLVKEYDSLRESFESNQGYMYKSLVRGVLSGLGLADDAYDKPISILSGGQKTRVALAKLLLQNPSLLLLDEPTNHLDIEAIEWLEGFLKSYNGAIIIISHDRYFLDKIVNKVVEIEYHKANIYDGDYSSFLVQKVARKEAYLRQYNNQQREIKKQEEVIEKLRQFNREKSIRRAESREKQLDKMELMEKPIEESQGMKLALRPEIQSGQDVLSARELSKSFGELELFKDLNFDIKKGDKIALVGPNGIGKTTLFRIIMGNEEPSLGTVTLGTNVVVGYYDQEHQNINNSNTILEELQETFPTTKTEKLRSVLAALLFTGDDVFKLISTLSGGEKGRVALAKIMLSKANFLLLDEPTNHLDIQSKEILEEALSEFEGTVLYVSHDRYFINKTASKVLEMSQTSMDTYLGNYDYYLEKKLENSQEIISKPLEASNSKDEWLRSKELQANTRRLKNQLADIEDSIHETEEAIGSIEEQLCLESVYTNPQKADELVREKSQLEKKLEELYHSWEEGSLALEEN